MTLCDSLTLELKSFPASAVQQLVPLHNSPTACVSCGGWEGGVAAETGKLKARKRLKDAARTHLSTARIVGRRLDHEVPHSIYDSI